MTEERERRRPVGRVGRAHGLRGAFYVEEADGVPEPGMLVRTGDRDRAIVRRAGMAERPLVALEGIANRDAAAAMKGMILTVSVADVPLDDGEWLADDLVGCEIAGLGVVRRVIGAPSCDLLEAGPDAVLVPFVRDAIRSVDLERRRIEVDRRFLGLDEAGGAARS